MFKNFLAILGAWLVGCLKICAVEKDALGVSMCKKVVKLPFFTLFLHDRPIVKKCKRPIFTLFLHS